jgi:hypothetical protein
MIVNDKKWEKLAVLGGLGFVALNVLATILQGTPPDPDGGNDEVLAWFADNDTSLRLSAFLGALSIMLLAWWFGSLWRRMSLAEGGSPRLSIVSLVGFAGSGVLFAMWNGVVATVALQVDQLDADTAKFFYVLTGVIIALGAAFLVVHLGAVSALSLRTNFLPKWVTNVGLVSAALWLVATIGTMTDQDPFPLFGLLGFVTWMIWIVGTSVHMWRTADGD